MEEKTPPDGLSRAHAKTINMPDKMGDPRHLTENGLCIDFDVDFNVMDESFSSLDDGPSSSTPSLSWTTQTNFSSSTSSNPETPAMPDLQNKPKKPPLSHSSAIYTCDSCPKRGHKPHELK